MLVSELIQKIHRDFTGRGKEKAPEPTDPKYAIYLSRANDNQDRYAEDPAVDNPELFAGDIDVTLSNGSIDLPEECAVVTDPVMYDGKPIPLISYKQRHSEKAGAYVTGKRGERKLTIINPSNYPLNTFTVGITAYPDTMTGPTSEVGCGNTRWLSLITAAQLAEQSPAKEDLAPSLFSQANAEYKESLGRAKQLTRGSARSMPVRGYVRVG